MMMGHETLQMIHDRYYSCIKNDQRNDGIAVMEKAHQPRDGENGGPSGEKGGPKRPKTKTGERRQSPIPCNHWLSCLMSGAEGGSRPIGTNPPPAPTYNPLILLGFYFQGTILTFDVVYSVCVYALPLNCSSDYHEDWSNAMPCALIFLPLPRCNRRLGCLLVDRRLP